MPVPLVIVFVGGAVTTDDTTTTVVKALESSLEPGTSVVLERVHDSDVDLTSTLAATRADAAASVVWTDALHAHVRAIVAATRKTVERDLVFRDQDSSDDRGRTVGFLLATLVAPPLPPPPPPIADRGPTASASGPQRVPFLTLDASFAATAGIGGDATAFGGELGLRRTLVRRVEARAAGMFGGGSIPTADASTTTLRIKGGVAFVVFDGGDPGSAAVRLDAIATRHAVTSALGSEARWVPCTAFIADLAARLYGPWSAFLDVGAEVAFGRTRVVVADEERATIPLVRVVTNAGLKVDF